MVSNINCGNFPTSIFFYGENHHNVFSIIIFFLGTDSEFLFFKNDH